jgi:hypothetical protein
MSTLELSNDDFLKVRARNLALGKIMHETCVGEVDEIRFDLRHKEINPTNGQRITWAAPMDIPPEE